MGFTPPGVGVIPPKAERAYINSKTHFACREVWFFAFRTLPSKLGGLIHCLFQILREMGFTPPIVGVIRVGGSYITSKTHFAYREVWFFAFRTLPSKLGGLESKKPSLTLSVRVFGRCGE